MKKAYKGIETSLYLMKSYEFLAYAHKKSFDEFDRDEGEPHVINYYCAPALINLNAAMVEGLVRSILIELVEKEIDIAHKSGLGDVPRAILQKARYEIETQGGWEKLQEQYSTYVGVTIKEIVGQESYRTINILFKLRNILAHGTALIEPLVHMSDSDKQYYPYKWQTRLQEISDYCNEVFGVKSVIDALALYSFPIHFFEVTKLVASAFADKYKGLHERVYEVCHEINVVKFGRKKLYQFM